MDGDHKQVAITEGAKNCLRDGKMLRRFVAFRGAEQPGCSIVCLSRLRHAKCTVADKTGGIENPTGCDATVNKPASDSTGFKKPEIE